MKLTLDLSIDIEVEGDWTQGTSGKMGKDPDDAEPPTGDCFDDVKMTLVRTVKGEKVRTELPDDVVEAIEGGDDFFDFVKQELIDQSEGGE